MPANLLSNRRNTREYLLMFFYSREFTDKDQSVTEAETVKFLEAVGEMKKEDRHENIRESVKEIFDNIKIIKLEPDDVIQFNLSNLKEPVSMTFEEMDSNNVLDGFMSKSLELTNRADLTEGTNSKDAVSGNQDNLGFFRRYIAYYFANLSKTDDRIISNLENWDFGRISIIDKIILRMGILELEYFKDIPPKVIINEAIELGKKYSTEKSNIFINGILNKLKNELRKNEN